MAPHPIQLTDPRTWPWMFDVWIAFVLFSFAKPAWRWFQRKRAETWPATPGRVESVEMNKSNFFLTSSSKRSSIASFTYSYEVGGTKYFGTYKKEFGTDEESDDFLRDLALRTSVSTTIQKSPLVPLCWTARSALCYPARPQPRHLSRCVATGILSRFGLLEFCHSSRLLRSLGSF